mmetsp:Transcript_24181/g.69517  ORF Transcript_24181/g.69517 Transcript_24181/m.69517 type:complete len:149 (-) Transcript_24181:198-644(-)
MAPKKKNVPSTPKALTTRSAAKTKNAIEDDTPDATSGGELVVARPGGVNGQEAVEIIGADLTKVLHGGKAVATMAPPQPQPREILDAATGTDILDAEDAAAADCASPAFQTPSRRPPRAQYPCHGWWNQSWRQKFAQQSQQAGGRSAR